MKIAMIGGGLMGLALARYLCSRGHAVVVFKLRLGTLGRERKQPGAVPVGEAIEGKDS